MKNTILVVDDEKDICDFFKDFLTEENYRVLIALNGEEGIEIVRKEKPDLVLLDIKMPGMDGIEVLEQMKSIHPEIQVIMVTAYGSLKTAREAMKLGAYDYITKPFDLKFIRQVIKDALSEGK